MTTNHYARAEELLTEAAKYENTVKHTVSKTLATMALAHAHLAQTKAMRQLIEEMAAARRPAPVAVAVSSTWFDREPAPELTGEERAAVERFENAPDALVEDHLDAQMAHYAGAVRCSE